MTTTAEQILKMIERTLASFASDPPDTEYQEGYLAALQNIKADILNSIAKDPKQ